VVRLREHGRGDCLITDDAGGFGCHRSNMCSGNVQTGLSRRWLNSAIAEYQEEGPAARVAATSATVYGSEQCESSQLGESRRDTVPDTLDAAPPPLVSRLPLLHPVILLVPPDEHIIEQEGRRERGMPVAAIRLPMLATGARVDL
jgi:hypothetical protein